MQPVQINLVAVILAAVASMVLGFVWYGPLFGKQWMKLSGMTQKDMEGAKKKGMEKMYMLAMVGSLVMAYVMAHFSQYTGAMTAQLGMQLGFWLWLGFVAPVQMSDVLWGKKSWPLYGLNTAFELVSMMAMGVILALWK